MKAAVEEWYAILKNYSALTTLLGGTSGDSRIYPEFPDKTESFPCIVYKVVGESYNTVPTKTTVQNVVFYIYSKTTATSVQNIYEAVNDALNYSKGSTRVVYAIQEDAFDQNSDDRLLFGKVMRFRITTRDI
jgi:hypothetical protein